MNNTCEICDYFASSKTLYNAHLKTQKHKINLINKIKSETSKEWICDICFQAFKHRQSLNKHNKQIHENIVETCKNQHNDQISESESKYIQIPIETVNSVICSLANIAKNTAEASVINANNTRKTINIVKHANTHYLNAPPLKPIPKKETMKLIENQRKEGEENERGEDILLRHYNNAELDIFIGEIIKAHYCVDDPSSRSLWKTDIERLNFIVKFKTRIDDDNNITNSEWIRDEDGRKIKDIIFVDFFKEIGDLLKKYTKEISSNDSFYLKEFDAKRLDIDGLSRIMKKKDDCLEIAKLLKTEDFRNKVLKYIGPYCRFDNYMANSNLKNSTDSIDLNNLINSNNLMYEKNIGVFEKIKEIIGKNKLIVKGVNFINEYFEKYKYDIDCVIYDANLFLPIKKINKIVDSEKLKEYKSINEKLELEILKHDVFEKIPKINFLIMYDEIFVEKKININGVDFIEDDYFILKNYLEKYFKITL